MDREDVINGTILSVFGVLLLGTIIFVLSFIFLEHEETLKVKGCSWERAVTIEKNTLCTEEDWYVPYGAEVIDSWIELRGYESIYVGVDDDGNSQYISVPDYDTKYRYKIWRYLYERTLSASGLKELGEMPVWPDVVLRDKERQGGRTERYIVHLEEDNKIVNLHTTLTQWQQVSKDMLVLGHKNIFGGLRRIDLAEAG